MSNLSGDGGGFSSGHNTGEEVLQQQKQEHQNPFHGSNSGASTTTTATANGKVTTSQPQQVKKKRNLPGTPDPTAEVIALSPTTLMATNRFVCEICNKGFQRDQNLQLHRRGHNLPWKLRQRTSTEIRKRVYICPETSCVHHNPSRALGDLTGIKKHFSRKHGEKKWKCDKCSKKYAVQSDWKAHSKTCGTREYKCDCGTIFSRRDSFITHRAFCDALAEENNKVNQGVMPTMAGGDGQGQVSGELMPSMTTNNPSTRFITDLAHESKNSIRPISHDLMPMSLKSPSMVMTGGMFSSNAGSLFGPYLQLSGGNGASGFAGLSDSKSIRPMPAGSSAHMSATALLQKAAHMGATASTNNIGPPMMQRNFGGGMAGSDQMSSLRTYNPVGFQNFDHGQTQASEHAQMVGIDGGGPGGYATASHLMMQKHSVDDVSAQFFDSQAATDSSGMNDMGSFSPFASRGDHQHSHVFLKNMELENGESGSNGGSLMHVRSTGTMPPISNGRGMAPPWFGGGDMATLDFMGVGPARSVALPEHHHHQQQQPRRGIEYEAMEQQRRLQGVHQFPAAATAAAAAAAMEKSLWDV